MQNTLHKKVYINLTLFNIKIIKSDFQSVAGNPPFILNMIIFRI